MMEYSNKKVLVVKAAVLIFLMGFSATVEAAGRLSQSPSSQFLDIGADDKYNYPERSQRFRRLGIIPEEEYSTKKKDCCERCECTLSYFGLRCKCNDVWESCPSSCPAGDCYCDKSHPPRCQCLASTLDNCTIPQCSS